MRTWPHGSSRTSRITERSADRSNTLGVTGGVLLTVQPTYPDIARAESSGVLRCVGQ
jgi:hypothetical protein